MDVFIDQLVGRDHELRTLQDALAAARRGRGSFVFVLGEPGIGKSRLVRRLAELGQQVAVFAGRAVPGSSVIAFRPLTEALLPMWPSDSAVEPQVAVWQAALRPLLDGAIRGSAVPMSGVAMGEAATRVLRWLRGERAALLVLEDLHWADPDTLAVVEYLADHVTGEAMLSVCTIRNEPSSPALVLARQLVQRGSASSMALRPLTDDAVAQMIRARRPEAPDALVRRVQATAEGVPLLVEELLVTDGVPASVDEAVRARMTGLSSEDWRVLAAAAVLGRDFDWQLLSGVVSQPEDAVIEGLERMVAASLLAVAGDGFRFRHALTREAVLAGLVPPRRAALARAFLAVHRTDALPVDLAAELAVQARDRVQAAALLTQSGRESLRRGAVGTAVATLRRAIEIVDRGSDRDAAQVALVQALAAAGRLDEAVEVGDQLITRLGIGTVAGPAAAEIHLQVARAAVAATRWRAAAVHLDAARGLLAARPDQRQRADVAILAAELALAGVDLDASTRAAQAALSEAEATGTAERLCHALELVGRSRRVYDLPTAQAAFERAAQVAGEAGLPLWQLRALHELGTIDLLDHAGTGRLQAARDQAERLGALSTAATLDLQLAAAYQLRFDLDAALVCARRAVAIAEPAGLGGILAMGWLFCAQGEVLLGDRAAMAEALARARRAAPDDPQIEALAWAGAVAMFELLHGDQEAALAAFDRGMPQLHRLPHSPPGHFRGLWPLLLASRDRPDALAAADEVRRSGAGVNRANRGYLHYTAAAFTTDGDAAMAAVADGDAALAYAPVWWQLGRALLAPVAHRQGWGHPDQWIAEAAKILTVHGIRTPGKTSFARLGLTDREADVLRLIAEGLANKEIADRLHISPRTVEKHVESLLRKADARSRTQLVARARPQGNST